MEQEQLKPKRHRTESPKDARNKQAVLDFIQNYRAAKGISPTLSEIAIGIGRTSADRSKVFLMVRDLIAKGFLVDMAPGSGSGRTLVLAVPLPRAKYYEEKGE